MRTLKIAVVNEPDQAHEVVNKFLALRHKKEVDPVLFIYNIGKEFIDGDQFAAIFPEPLILCVFNCDSDLITKKEYGEDYLTANADALVVAQQMVGVDCELPTFYNFFSKPKNNGRQNEIDALKKTRETENN